jgi:hypothetical protein
MCALRLADATILHKVKRSSRTVAQQIAYTHMLHMGLRWRPTFRMACQVRCECHFSGLPVPVSCSNAHLHSHIADVTLLDLLMLEFYSYAWCGPSLARAGMHDGPCADGASRLTLDCMIAIGYIRLLSCSSLCRCSCWVEAGVEAGAARMRRSLIQRHSILTDDWDGIFRSDKHGWFFGWSNGEGEHAKLLMS